MASDEFTPTNATSDSAMLDGKPDCELLGHEPDEDHRWDFSKIQDIPCSLDQVAFRISCHLVWRVVSFPLAVPFFGSVVTKHQKFTNPMYYPFSAQKFLFSTESGIR